MVAISSKTNAGKGGWKAIRAITELLNSIEC